MVIDRRAIWWAAVSAVLLGAATAVYLPYQRNALNGPSGGSWHGLVFGFVGTSMMAFVLLLGLRKQFRSLPLGRAQWWMQGHVWFGTISYPIIWFHAGFRWGGTLTTLLMVLFTIVWVSGIVGLIIQNIIPRRIARRLPYATIYEQIDHVIVKLREEADELVASAAGREDPDYERFSTSDVGMAYNVPDESPDAPTPATRTAVTERRRKPAGDVGRDSLHPSVGGEGRADARRSGRVGQSGLAGIRRALAEIAPDDQIISSTHDVLLVEALAGYRYHIRLVDSINRLPAFDPHQPKVREGKARSLAAVQGGQTIDVPGFGKTRIPRDPLLLLAEPAKYLDWWEPAAIFYMGNIWVTPSVDLSTLHEELFHLRYYHARTTARASIDRKYHGDDERAYLRLLEISRDPSIELDEADSAILSLTNQTNPARDASPHQLPRLAYRAEMAKTDEGGVAVAEPTAATETASIRRLAAFHAECVRPMLVDRYARTAPLAREPGSSAAFAELRAKLPDAQRPVADRLEVIVEERRQLQRQRRLHRILHWWLLIHVPPSYAMGVLVAIHAVMALKYAWFG